MVSKNSKDLEQYRLHERFGYKMSKLARQMQSRMEPGLEKHAITRVQWVALSSIEIEKMCSPSDLAKHIGVSRPAISRLLKQMEAQHLIQRSLMGEDARTRQLSLTDKGREALNLSWPHIRETEQYFLDKLSEQEQESFSRAMDALMAGETEALDEI